LSCAVDVAAHGTLGRRVKSGVKRPSGMAPLAPPKTAPLVVMPVRSRRSQWSSAEDHSGVRTSRTYRI